MRTVLRPGELLPLQLTGDVKYSSIAFASWVIAALFFVPRNVCTEQLSLVSHSTFVDCHAYNRYSTNLRDIQTVEQRFYLDSAGFSK